MWSSENTLESDLALLRKGEKACVLWPKSSSPSQFSHRILLYLFISPSSQTRLPLCGFCKEHSLALLLADIWGGVSSSCSSMEAAQSLTPLGRKLPRDQQSSHSSEGASLLFSLPFLSLPYYILTFSSIYSLLCSSKEILIIVNRN